ncbi:alpha/beta hydrolase [Novosphingobium sp. TH158]|uniref:alpha/beta hydrolase n=1 Tax=Novosphingobium sp. TH158 TaxID=2067455 RepID=UPI000C7BFFAE|nr:alpha/beta hydrolase [Novosphingobium sp. TH158]PLK26438.1 esterase [Novosphingobium sp. TH158]
MKTIRKAVLAAALMLPSPLLAQPVFDIAKAPDGPVPGSEFIPVHGKDNPGSPSDEVVTRFMGRETVIRNITYPTLTPVFPPKGKANGTAVIVAPGGGFSMLSLQNEGWRTANALAEKGYTAFVLKYRLNPSPKDDNAFLAEMSKLFANAGKGDGKLPEIVNPGSDKDALAALKLIRARAEEWHVNPNRVGIIGFSAGAITALRAVLSAPTPAERPDFFGYIYGPMAKIDVPADAPPMFAALAMDDMLFGNGDFGIVSAWKAARRTVELHVYERGGHGFGLGQPGTTSTGMIGQFLGWMESRGLLKLETKK